MQLPAAGFAHRHVCEASHTANVHTLNLIDLQISNSNNLQTAGSNNLFDMQNSNSNTLQTVGSNNLHMYREYPNLHISSEFEEDVHDSPPDSEEDVTDWAI